MKKDKYKDSSKKKCILKNQALIQFLFSKFSVLKLSMLRLLVFKFSVSKSLLFAVLYFASAKVCAELTLTMGGDVNFNKSNFPPSAEGFIATGENSYSRNRSQIISWEELTKHLKSLIDGDINFANIETVITDRNDLKEQPKKFKFRTHPHAMGHLLDIGFNLFSVANNHAYDYGYEGINDTLKNLEELKRSKKFFYHGIGTRDQLLTPLVFQIKGYTVAFAAISIAQLGFRAINNKLGVLDIRSRKDYYDLVLQMKNTKADLKIISIHYGTESQVGLDEGQKKYYEYAIDHGGADLIIGHHPHSVRPVSLYKNKLIFYSLGNYLMLGSSNITQNSGGRDWGMFAKVVYNNNLQVAQALQALQLEAVQLKVLTQTHSRAQPMEPNKAKSRWEDFLRLNSVQLTESALPLTIGDDGSAYYCNEGFSSVTARKICRGTSVFVSGHQH